MQSINQDKISIDKIREEEKPFQDAKANIQKEMSNLENEFKSNLHETENVIRFI